MPRIGLAAALEQFHPNELLTHCTLAEHHGFEGVMAADHFQPWVPAQGHNAFAYSWMGALGMVTQGNFGPGVTCPSFRTHPAVVAQAAATLGAMFPGRFWLGLGSGELLNENVVAGPWPDALVRFEMLQEATEIIQRLLSGKAVRYRGRYFSMNKVQLWTLPEQRVPIYIAATGPQTVRWAGKVCDGLITPGASHEKLRGILENFAQGAREAGRDPAHMPKLLQLHVSWATTYDEALQSALVEWPNGGMNFPKQDVRGPEDFAAMARLVRPEHFQGRVLISPDLEAHRAHLQGFFELGFDAIYVHNVGRNQEQWIKAYGEHVLPKLK
ncbi:TIGR03557 family F420-dependent LLM class oxidoreductase [Candidatus Viridilinea mediisalina]|uniref:LLM class F420-dependent oxidoreductase n=1 Tax=Candidatus Viridilinea mediisalina TaxID=2024553 RepID=A0A2A6RLX7_9CHLR|nr:TIGR03557 family F420-dependent LLM class oxidoreductase [Candidatus Viridilinea mediisalina]PDW04104.1 LLM class F420-dependent oxidoreductase [Candidatus Viridilinea mediisalina]